MLKANPRRRITALIPTTLNESGTGFLTVEDLFAGLGLPPIYFKGQWVQVSAARLWGGSGLSGGATKFCVATLTDMQTGVSVTDRGKLDQAPRCGLRFPPAARRVYNHLDTEQLFQLTATDGSGKSTEYYFVLTVDGW